MADGGYDPCECVYGRERAMQRLLSMISTGQSHCTDSQCLPSDNPGLGTQTNGSDGDSSMMIGMMVLWMVVAVILFLMRPKSLRGRGGKGDDDWEDDSDDHRRHRGGNNHPPAPEIH